MGKLLLKLKFTSIFILSFFTCFSVNASTIEQNKCVKEIEEAVKEIKSREGYFDINLTDLEGNGRYEILVEEAHGGNCCAPKLWIKRFDDQCGDKIFQFERWGSVWGGWKAVKSSLSDGIVLLTAENDPYGIGGTDLLKSYITYKIEKDEVIFHSSKKAELLPSIIEITSAQLAGSKNIDERVEMKFDLNGDDIPESISCSYWDRWGVLSDCKILAKNGNNLLGAKDFTAKRLGVLFDIENGWHVLVADYDSLLSYIDGIGFSEKN